jgi:oxygen-dependent protoporphyrinogen oxidase
VAQDGHRRIIIVGAGIAGLSIASAIKQRAPDVEVMVLERSARVGGNIRTERLDGYVCEWGPDGFLDNAPATLALARDLALSSRLLPSNDAARTRYIFRQGHLCEVPTSIGAFLKSPLLSTRAKLRVMGEPFAASRKDDEESILDFARRRIGVEAAAVLVDPMVSGIFAGNADALSLKACFPRMRQIEDDHGGLVRGLLATRRARKADDAAGAPAGRLTSFVGGMSDLVDGLTHSLGRVVRTSLPVTALHRNQTPALHTDGISRHRYAVTTSQGALDADAVVLSGPAAESAAILRDLDGHLASLLQSIPTAPLAVICLGYDAATLRSQCQLDGFGFLVPRQEGVRILGALWETSIYRHRAPDSKALLRVMIGGARDPEATSLSDADLLRIVRDDLARTMNVSAVPELVRVIRHPRGIPQYVKGHLARLHQLDVLLEAHPGVFLAGNSYRGVSINSCIADAESVADAALDVVRGARCATRVDAISV